MTVKLHTCPNPWVGGGHPCHKVLKALKDEGIEHEVVKNPLRRGKRDELIAKTGQNRLPMIEFEDGTTYRAESKDMIARIKAGQLLDAQS